MSNARCSRCLASVSIEAAGCKTFRCGSVYAIATDGVWDFAVIGADCIQKPANEVRLVESS